MTPGLPGDFIFDDIPNIVDNRAIHLTELDAEGLASTAATPQISGVMRVVPTVTFALDYWRGGGPDPAVFKTTNIVIHALTTLALAGFFRSLMLVAGMSAAKVQWLAPALAFAWAAHPLQVSSVLYAVQRIQTLGTFFLVLALWAYLQARHAQLQGRPGRTGFLLAGLLWACALGCKEDSTLLPAYALALELTVLRFAAADAGLATRLRRSYLLLVIAGVVSYFLFVVPHFWQWEPYPGRTYSTLERLLTQPRMLCMYLGQILIPLPHQMPFYYDWVDPSRSIFAPRTTLPAIGIVALLLAAAWRFRTRRPLFALGVFLFFAAHFIASNVPDLELAFEHRNHFALVGAVLAVGSFLELAASRMRLGAIARTAGCATLLLALSGTTLFRANTWSSTLEIARVATENAPLSGRAWSQLCASHFVLGGGSTPGNSQLDEAIEICSEGTRSAQESASSLALLVVLKSVRGDVSSEDWKHLQRRLRTVYMTRDNARAYMVLTYHAGKGVELDRQELLKTLEIFAQRGSLDPFALASIGYFIMNSLSAPEFAIPYFSQAISKSHPADPFPLLLSAELEARGEHELAEQVRVLGRARQSANTE